MPENNLFSYNQKEPEGSYGYGILLAFGLNAAFALIMIVIFSLLYDFSRSFLAPPLAFIGVSQWIYIIPAIVLAFAKGKSHLVKGLLIGAGITFLLNAACAGAVMMGSF